MELFERCLDKLSRLTRHPTMKYFPKRVYQRFLEVLWCCHLYRIPEPPLFCGFDGDLSILLSTDVYHTRHLWFRGYMEYDEEYFLRQYVKPDMTIIDAGANVGYISLLMAKRVLPGGSVHSFEPLSCTFDVLCRNIAANKLEDTVHANHAALADQSGIMLELETDVERSGLTHLVVSATESPKAREQVAIITLDDYFTANELDRVDLFKIDVEGAEMMVVEGARETLTRYLPIVVCEFNCQALARFNSSARDLWDLWDELEYKWFKYNHRRRELTVVSRPPSSGCETFVGTTEPNDLAQSVGATISS